MDDIKTPDVKSEADKRCAPNLSFEGGSCIKLDLLLDMVNAYNESSQNKIKLFPSYETLNPKKYKKYLVTELKKIMDSKCTTQKCWTEQSFINKMKKKAKDQLQKFTFRPTGPEGKFEWLNTLNINDVMEQYEMKHPEFKFLGAVPIDFDDLPTLGIKDLNFKKLLETGKTKLGVVFNLDEHYKSGSHWVALYSDLKNGEVYFFDSYGIRPENRIRTFMRRIAKFSQTGLGVKEPVADHNKVRHQYGNSECGVYSMNFIIRMLEGDSFQNVCNSKVPDKEINKYRNMYFSNAKV